MPVAGIGRVHARSTKTGAEAPVTHDRDSRSEARILRSTKTGAEAPVTPEGQDKCLPIGRPAQQRPGPKPQ